MVIPKEIEKAIEKNAVLAVSISGGKDSQALLHQVVRYHEQNKLPNRIFAIHADLGRAEWEQTPAFVEKQCKDLNIELVVVRAEKDGEVIDLLDGWVTRKKQLEGTNKPFWSSAQNRYCTSKFKTAPINKYLREFDHVISVEGIRWAESKARSLKPRWKIRKEIAAKGRKAFTWNAICDFSSEKVWSTCGQSENSYREAQRIYRETKKVPEWWNFHPAYAMGNNRLSCAICVLANKNDFANGIKHNPWLANQISNLEKETGFSFIQGKTIESVRRKNENVLF